MPYTNKSKLKQTLLKEMGNARKSKCLETHKNKWLHSLQRIWDVCIERNRF